MSSGLDGASYSSGLFPLVQNGKRCVNFQERDIILLKTEAKRNQWPMAKVVDVNLDSMGFIQSVQLLLPRTQDGVGERVLERSLYMIVLIKEAEIRFSDNVKVI